MPKDSSEYEGLVPLEGGDKFVVKGSGKEADRVLDLSGEPEDVQLVKRLPDGRVLMRRDAEIARQAGKKTPFFIVNRDQLRPPTEDEFKLIPSLAGVGSKEAFYKILGVPQAKETESPGEYLRRAAPTAAEVVAMEAIGVPPIAKPGASILSRIIPHAGRAAATLGIGAGTSVAAQLADTGKVSLGEVAEEAGPLPAAQVALGTAGGLLRSGGKAWKRIVPTSDSLTAFWEEEVKPLWRQAGRSEETKGRVLRTTLESAQAKAKRLEKEALERFKKEGGLEVDKINAQIEEQNAAEKKRASEINAANQRENRIKRTRADKIAFFSPEQKQKYLASLGFKEEVKPTLKEKITEEEWFKANKDNPHIQESKKWKEFGGAMRSRTAMNGISKLLSEHDDVHFARAINSQDPMKSLEYMRLLNNPDTAEVLSEQQINRAKVGIQLAWASRGIDDLGGTGRINPLKIGKNLGLTPEASEAILAGDYRSSKIPEHVREIFSGDPIGQGLLRRMASIDMIAGGMQKTGKISKLTGMHLALGFWHPGYSIAAIGASNMHVVLGKYAVAKMLMSDVGTEEIKRWVALQNKLETQAMARGLKPGSTRFQQLRKQIAREISPVSVKGLNRWSELGAAVEKDYEMSKTRQANEQVRRPYDAVGENYLGANPVVVPDEEPQGDVRLQ